MGGRGGYASLGMRNNPYKSLTLSQARAKLKSLELSLDKQSYKAYNKERELPANPTKKQMDSYLKAGTKADDIAKKVHLARNAVKYRETTKTRAQVLKQMKKDAERRRRERFIYGAPLF